MRKAGYGLGLALLVAASLYLLPALQAASNPVADSPEVSDLLRQAKNQAVQLRDDADVMQSLSTTSHAVWDSHAGQISMIKEHTNRLGKVLQEMRDNESLASPWQKEAMDRVIPLARELASNIETTIEHLNKNQDRLHTRQYRDYLKANYEVSVSLSSLIGDFVAYGNNKAKYERLGSKLEIAR